ncbi:MAG TPA: sugar-binding protein [Chthoniobacteraceae bacterium]|nr:sugar-binding protein [Chthoniobacteraceae bacterium]
MIPRFFLALAFCLSASGLAADELPPVLPVGAPEIDGRINPGEWERAHYLGRLTPCDGADLPDTDAWMAMDQSNLYIAVRCAEPQMERLKTHTLPEEQKAAVWLDDSVELFLDIGNTAKAIYHLVGNTNGTYYDSQIIHLKEVASAWDSGATIRTSRGREGWEMEIAIPMLGMGHQLQRGEVISVNVGRNRYAGGRHDIGSLAKGHFVFPQHFARLLVGGPVEGPGYRMISTRRGPFFEKEPGVWEFQLLGAPGQTPELTVVFPDANPPVRETPALSANQRFFQIPIAAGRAAAYQSCVVTAKGVETPLYRSRHEVRPFREPARVATTADPLFESLLEPRPEALSREGVLMWPHELLHPMMADLPFRTGSVYREEDAYRQYGKDRSILWCMGAVLTPERLGKFDRHRVAVAYCLDARRALPAGVPVDKTGHPWLLDPRAREAYLADAEKAIAMAREHPSIRFLAAGDETWEKMHRSLLAHLDDKESYPELQAVDEEIRQQYGFGKYGLPESSVDTNPFRWIATYRWELDRMLEIQKKIRKRVQEEAPHLKMISWDNVNGLRPYGIGRWHEAFDVIIHQLYPSGNPRRELFGAQTRFYADLFRKPENWPLPHIENYGANFKPGEVTELLSQCLRNGATGFSFYLADTRAQRAGKANPVVERIGAPERWNVIRDVMERVTETPFIVRQPVADTAIFYSNTSYQGTGTGEGHALQFRARNEGEWIYTVLGPRLRSALAFIDDHALEKRRLTDYKAIYIPYMPIADDAEYRQLEEYVKGGGSLIVCDPLAFRHRSDGTLREEGLLQPPLEDTAALPPQEVVFEKKALVALSPAYRLKAGEGRVLASYPGGDPAVVEVRHGKGRITYFGQNPLRARVIEEAGWISLFRTLQVAAGASLGEEVWRFRLPTPAAQGEGSSHPAEVSLTGNAMEWRASAPVAVAASRVRGSYQLSVADDASKEPAGEPVPFAEGRLTDRLKGAQAANDADPRSFTLRWKSAPALGIHYTFDQAVEVQRIDLFFHGRLPEGRLEYSADGEHWQPGEAWEAQVTRGAGDVERKQVAVAAGRFTHYRLQFSDVRDFELVETDFLGKEP